MKNVFNNMVFFVCLTVLAVVCIMSAPYLENIMASQSLGVILTNPSGAVQVMRAGTNEWITIDDSTQISLGDRIRTTGADSSVILNFPDGTTMELTQDTDIGINGLGDENSPTMLDVEAGYVKFDTTKSKNPSYGINMPLAFCSINENSLINISITNDATTIGTDTGNSKIENLLTGALHNMTAGETITIRKQPQVLGYTVPETNLPDQFSPDPEEPASRI